MRNYCSFSFNEDPYLGHWLGRIILSFVNGFRERQVDGSVPGVVAVAPEGFNVSDVAML